MSEKALVLFSGGVDSTTCLGLAIDRYGKENVIALSVSYGQKHEKEIEASRKIAEYYGVEHLYLDLGAGLYAAGYEQLYRNEIGQSG